MLALLHLIFSSLDLTITTMTTADILNIRRRCLGAMFWWSCFLVGYNTVSSDTGPLLNLSTTVNQRVVLPCNTSKSVAVLWSFQSRNGGVATEVSISGEIVGKYKDIYELDRTRVGEFNLVIKSAQSTDSGQYTCDEENGVGDRHLIYLSVSGQYSTASDSAESATSTYCDSEQHQSDSTAGWIAAIVVLSCLLVLAVSVIVAMYFGWQRKSKSRHKKTTHANEEPGTGSSHQNSFQEDARREELLPIVEPDAPQPDEDNTKEKIREERMLTEVEALALKYNTNDLYGNRIRDAFVYYITRHHDEFKWCVRRMAAHIRALKQQIDVIVGLNAYGSRGDILAWHTAYFMDIPYAEMAKVRGSRRKDVEQVDFVAGSAEDKKIYTLEMVKDACQPKMNAVIIGSVVANGGTMRAAWQLLSSKFKVNVIAYLCFIRNATYDQAVGAPELFHVLDMDLNSKAAVRQRIESPLN